MLTWNETNALAAGAGGDPQAGLTEAGRRAVRRMGELGMVVDVSHLNDGGFWDVMDLAAGPVIASHSNCRALCDVRRNLSDDQLRRIRDTGGVVGLNAFHGFVHAEPRQQTARTLALHAVHMAEDMGVEHVGCGFAFCEFMGPGNEGRSWKWSPGAIFCGFWRGQTCRRNEKDSCSPSEQLSDFLHHGCVKPR